MPATSRDGRSPAKPNDADGPAPRAASKKFARFVDYNFSAMTDTKGGFLSAEDDPFNRSMNNGGSASNGGPGEGEEQKPKHMTAAEWERLQLLRKLQRTKAGPFEPGMSALVEKEARKVCRECGGLEIDFVWAEVFSCCVCGACKEKFPEKYSLLTKTECREDYLITDGELHTRLPTTNGTRTNAPSQANSKTRTSSRTCRGPTRTSLTGTT